MYKVTYEIQEILTTSYLEQDEDESYGHGHRVYDEVDYEVVGTLDFQVEEEDGAPTSEEVLKAVSKEYGLKGASIEGDFLSYKVNVYPAPQYSTKPVYNVVAI